MKTNISKILRASFVLALVASGGARALAAAPLALADPLPGISPTIGVSGLSLGLADTHSHQMSVHGFGGGLIWGDPHNPVRSTALAACDGGDHGFPQTISALMLTAFGTTFGLVANEVQEEEIPGRAKYCKGYTGDGQGYTGWPIWGSMVKQQLSQVDLKKAHDEGDLNLLVMSAVSFQPLCDYLPTDNRKYHSYYYKSDDAAYRSTGKKYTCNEHDNIMAQINFALDFEAANSTWYKIVRSAQEAEDTMLEGKLAVVLHIESTHLFQSGTQASVPNINTYLQWMYNKGVRSIQLAHELDSWAAGVAFWDAVPNMARLANCMDKKNDGNIFNDCVIVALASQGDYEVNLDASDKNTLGLTSNGEKLLRSMYASCMIPDLAHISAKAFTSARTISRESAADFPLFVSHAPAIQSIADYGQIDEYQKTDTQITQIRDSGGIVGLRSAPYKMKTVSGSGVANTCHGTTRSYAQTLAKARDLGVNVALAFDMSGMAQNLGPRFKATGTKWEALSNEDKWTCPSGGTADTSPSTRGTGTDYDYIGMGHIGLVGALTTDLEKVGYNTTELDESAANFVDMWRGIEAAAPAPCQYRYRTTPLL